LHPQSTERMFSHSRTRERERERERDVSEMSESMFLVLIFLGAGDKSLKKKMQVYSSFFLFASVPCLFRLIVGGFGFVQQKQKKV
jgi:hypothetical protein